MNTYTGFSETDLMSDYGFGVSDLAEALALLGYQQGNNADFYVSGSTIYILDDWLDDGDSSGKPDLLEGIIIESGHDGSTGGIGG